MAASRRADDSATIREIVRVLCETVIRSRTAPLARRQPLPVDLASAWFNVQSDRMPDVEASLGAWRSDVTTPVRLIISSAGTVIERWIFNYVEAPVHAAVEGDSVRKRRAYVRLMILARSLQSVAGVLPAQHVVSRSRFEYRFMFGPAPDTDNEQMRAYAFPAIETAQGSFTVRVYWNVQGLLQRPVSPPGKLSVIEDYVPTASPSQAPSSTRWLRWSSPSFEEREKELLSAGHPRDESEDDEAEMGPPQFSRVSSNPMAIPSTNKSASTKGVGGRAAGSGTGTSITAKRPFPSHAESAPAMPGQAWSVGTPPHHHLRNLSGDGVGVLSRYNSANTGLVYSFADLVGPLAGTPIMSSLPFVGSVGSSVTSGTGTDASPANLRARFLAGLTVLTPTTGVSPHPSRRSSTLAPGSQPGVGQSEPRPVDRVYSAALPWTLSPEEIDRPFSQLDMGSLLVGTSPHDEGPRRLKKDDSSRAMALAPDDPSLPFAVSDSEDEDVVETRGQRDQRELGAFVRRLNEAPLLFESETADKTRTEWERLVREMSLTRSDDHGGGGSGGVV